MQRKQMILGVVASAAVAAAAFAQVNVGLRHPNMQAAQRDITAAIGDLDRAQHANDWDMNGHAAKAKQLLEQADAEIKAAAVTANRR